MKRFLATVLALMLLLAALALVSCGDSTTGGSEDDYTETVDPEAAAIESYLETYKPEDTAVTYVEDVEKTYDYEGYDFTFLNSAAIYYMYIYLDPDMTGDVLDDCCFERNLNAEQKFNITISEETQPFDGLASYAKTLILADEDVYDAMYIPASALTPLISENLFYDLLEIEELNIDGIWWDQPLIERNIIEDRLFYATSDLNLMAFEGIWCMYFNEDMMVDLGLDLPFELALTGNWTFDELKKYCAAAANLNGDTTFALDPNGNSTYGLISLERGPTFMAYAMRTEFVSRDDTGRYKFTADTDPKFSNVWESLINFWGAGDGLAVFKLSAAGDLDPGGYYYTFEQGRALFLSAELKGATMLREWEGTFGLMPQPKYDSAQETYESTLFSGCLSFCIPNTNTNLERTGTIVDYLTYESYRSLLPRYYDIHVALKSLDRQESIDILGLIRGTRGIEVSLPFGWLGNLQTDMQNLAMKHELAIGSTVEKYRDQIIANIDKTYEEYPTYNSITQGE